MTNHDPKEDKGFAIVGAGATAMRLRKRFEKEGFKGRIVMITRETVFPFAQC
jgi:hypothetical protein